MINQSSYDTSVGFFGPMAMVSGLDSGFEVEVTTFDYQKVVYMMADKIYIDDREFYSDEDIEICEALGIEYNEYYWSTYINKILAYIRFKATLADPMD